MSPRDKANIRYWWARVDFYLYEWNRATDSKVRSYHLSEANIAMDNYEQAVNAQVPSAIMEGYSK